MQAHANTKSLPARRTLVGGADSDAEMMGPHTCDDSGDSELQQQKCSGTDTGLAPFDTVSYARLVGFLLAACLSAASGLVSSQGQS